MAADRVQRYYRPENRAISNYRCNALGAGASTGRVLGFGGSGVKFWSDDSNLLRPMIAALAAGFVAHAVNSQLYFFSGPVIVEILIALCLGTALFTAKNPSDARL